MSLVPMVSPRAPAGAALLWLALVAMPGAAACQVALSPVQPLDFGTLVPGVIQQVAPDDAWARGEVRLDGEGALRVRFLLPDALTSASGARVPLLFGAADGRIEMGRGGRQEIFDPRVGTAFSLPRGLRGASVILGGTAAPAAHQAAGEYTGTVVIVVTRTDT